jgi:hypothetical protein
MLPKIARIKICKCIILPVFLYGSETWFLTLREKYRLRIFGNRALKKIFGHNKDEIKVGWRKLHNEELHNLYSSPSTIEMTK